jgi:restriction system protein
MGRKKIHDKVPTYDKMLIPTVKALKELGGSGSIDEINEEVYRVASANSRTKIKHENTAFFF